jgi:hypothetical protein
MRACGVRRRGKGRREEGRSEERGKTEDETHVDWLLVLALGLLERERGEGSVCVSVCPTKGRTRVRS